MIETTPPRAVIHLQLHQTRINNHIVIQIVAEPHPNDNLPTPLNIPNSNQLKGNPPPSTVHRHVRVVNVQWWRRAFRIIDTKDNHQTEVKE
jgi:hypothetical protein